MKLNYPKVFIILIAFFCNSTKGQNLVRYELPKYFEMPPKTIATVRKYWVSLPKDYNETKDRYPVIFLFDGNEEFLRNLILFDADQLTTNGEMPPCIIVGIMQRNRTLDFGPLYAVKSNPNSSIINGDKFFDFIKEELYPELKKNYRTQDFKIGIGHSLGGLFLLNSFTKDPEFFNGMIAISPALQLSRDSILFHNVETRLNAKLHKQTYFCWASGTEGVNEIAFQPASQKLQKLFNSHLNTAFHFKYINLPGKNHNVTPLYGMLSAFDHMFDSWNIRRWYQRLFYDKSVDPITIYQQRSALMKKIYGFDEDPTEDRIQNNVGLQLFARQRYNEALAYMQRATELKPTSSSYYEDLSETQEKLKHYPAAALGLKKALENLSKASDDYQERYEKYHVGLKRIDSLIKNQN